MALSDKLVNGTLVILDDLKMEEFKTKKFNEFLTAIESKILKNERRNILIINDSKDDKIKYSARNLKGTEIINLENINIVELLKFKNLLLTEAAVKTLEERYK